MLQALLPFAGDPTSAGLGPARRAPSGTAGSNSAKRQTFSPRTTMVPRYTWVERLVLSLLRIRGTDVCHRKPSAPASECELRRVARVLVKTRCSLPRSFPFLRCCFRPLCSKKFGNAHSFSAVLGHWHCTCICRMHIHGRCPTVS